MAMHADVKMATSSTNASTHSDDTWWERVNAPFSADDMSRSWIIVMTERYFKVKQRGTSLKSEVKAGFVHFISAGFILSVNAVLLCEPGVPGSPQMSKVAAATALSSGLACILCGFLSNLPFVLAPTSPTAIYFALFVEKNGLTVEQGNLAVFMLSILLCLCGFRFVSTSISRLIPFVMKVGICLGVGLLIALAALTEIGIVQQGEGSRPLGIGVFTSEVYIAMFSFVVIGLALHYKLRGAFLIGLVCALMLHWVISEDENLFSKSFEMVKFDDVKVRWNDIAWDSTKSSIIYRLVFDLLVICIILMSGLAFGLAESAGLKRADNTLPRGKWLYVSCGISTYLSAFLGSGPIMISPESAPGIKAGARTGISSIVCGILFFLSTVVCRLFAAVPESGTSPVLLMIGLFMFENAGKVNWSVIRESLPVFIMTVFVPFTYSIFFGIFFGFAVHIIMLVFTEGAACRRQCSKSFSRARRSLRKFMKAFSNPAQHGVQLESTRDKRVGSLESVSSLNNGADNMYRRQSQGVEGGMLADGATGDIEQVVFASNSSNTVSNDSGGLQNGTSTQVSTSAVSQGTCDGVDENPQLPGGGIHGMDGGGYEGGSGNVGERHEHEYIELQRGLMTSPSLESMNTGARELRYRRFGLPFGSGIRGFGGMRSDVCKDGSDDDDEEDDESVWGGDRILTFNLGELWLRHSNASASSGDKDAEARASQRALRVNLLCTNIDDHEDGERNTHTRASENDISGNTTGRSWWNMTA